MKCSGTGSPASISFPPRHRIGRSGVLAILATLIICFALAGEAAALVIDTVSPLPSATQGIPYNQTFFASGGPPPYSWSLIGTLPGGLTLDPATGVLSGTPLVTGTYTFTVEVIDATSAIASAPFSLDVFPNTPVTNVRYDISGTVAYSGTKTGRIYISTSPADSGVSIAAPGAFTIRGVPGTATTINAWMDVQGTGNRHATDPFGSTTLTTSTTAPPAVVVIITDPPPQPPLPPLDVNVSRGDGSVFVQWGKGARNDKVEYADSYSLYWSTSPAVSPTQTTGGGKRQNIPADGNGNTAVTGLTNATPLYFVMTATVGGVESAPSPVIGPVIPGPAAGGSTVSGTVTISGVTPSGPLYVAVVDEKNKVSNIYFTSIATPTATNAFSIGGVADGSYRVFAGIDMNNDLIMGNLGDVTLPDVTALLITVAGAPVSGLTLDLAPKNAFATLQTEHWRNASFTGEGYALIFGVRNGIKQPVNVTVNSGPNVTGPVDIGRFDSGETHAWVDTFGVRPVPGDAYPMTLAYSDGSSETISLAVNGIYDNFPTATAPLGNQTLVPNPVFTWNTAAGATSYALWVNGNGLHWDSWNLPTTQTSITYNADGSGFPSTFISPGTYDWAVYAIDANGNRATDHATFNAVALPDSVAPTIGAFTLPALSSSLTVPITSFTASDNLTSVAYIVTESATTPLLTDPGWMAAPPLFHTFSTPGTKTLYAWVRDGSGNFSTRASASVTIDTTPPSVAGTSPASGATLSGTTPQFAVTFSEPVAPATLTPATILLTTNGVNQAITVTSYDAATYTVTFTPAAPLSGGTQVVTLTTGITDLAGNPLSAPSSLSFALSVGGDMDGDGTVSVADAVLALRMAVGAVTPTAADLVHGDVAPLLGGVPAPDGRIDIGDAVVILRRVVGLVTW